MYESYKLDPLCQAAEAARKAGIVVLATGRNNGRDNFLGTQGYATYNALTKTVSLVTGANVVWGSNVVWSSSVNNTAESSAISINGEN